LNWICGRQKPGLCLDPLAIHYGGNSGYQAINLAFNWGARRIILLGFDMGKAVDGRSHYFGDHPAGLRRGGNFRNWIADFEQLAADLKAEGVEVVNCSRSTALRCFPRMDLQSALRGEAQTE
jgi:hypothetical protein